MDDDAAGLHPLMIELWPLGPHHPPEGRLAATYRAYTAATGRAVGQPPSDDDRRSVREWLIAEDWSMPTDDRGHSVALLHQRTSYTRPLIHPDAASKSSWLQQAPCTTCLPNDEVAPRVSFAVRTRPFSAQSLSADGLRSLKAKITASFLERHRFEGDWSRSNVCISVVAVMGRRDPRKDVDNMVKGLLDAVQGNLFPNDQAISHLSVHRFRHAGDEGHYLLHVRPVRDPLDDVVDPYERISWLGTPEITVDRLGQETAGGRLAEADDEPDDSPR